MNKKLQGLMFARNVGNKIILLGIIDSKEEIQNEAQHEFIGHVKPDGRFSIQTTGTVIDIKDIARGNTPDGLLQLPIWKT